MHAVDFLFAPLANLALFPEGGEFPDLGLDETARRAGTARLPEGVGRPVMIHPGSGSPRKNWPLESFLELSRRLTASGLTPVFSLGEADDGIAAQVATVPGLHTLQGFDLMELAETIGACAAYVGNDSGITHLAAAAGVPVVALFGETDPAVWGPRGPHVRVLQGEGGCMDRIRVDEVMGALVTAMESHQ